MLATVNSQRRSVSRGPGDQAQRVVMGAEAGEMGGAGEGGSLAFSRGRRTLPGDILAIDFLPLLGVFLCFRDVPDVGESGTGRKVNGEATPADS